MAEPTNQTKSFGLQNIISKDSEHFKPESGRYHLYITYGCPFAHRAFIAWKLKGLEDHIGLSIAHSVMQKTKPGVDDHAGWAFKNENDEPVTNVAGKGSFSCKGCIPDTINNCKTVRELYEISGNAPTVYSVPVLWDKKNKTIVNNESAQILRMFSSAFNDFAKNPGLDFYPEALRTKIDETSNWIQSDINTGVYKAVFAQNQQDYEAGVNTVFNALDRVEDILSKSRYICGDQLTESDIRLFTTVIRFDEVYHILFKCNKKKIVDYPNILNWCREVYQIPGVAETINLDIVRESYFNSPKFDTKFESNTGIVPIGTNFLATLKEKHNRENLK